MGHASFVIAQELTPSSGEERLAREEASPAPVGGSSDTELVALARARSPGVEALLYERLAPLVNRLVWSTLGPDSEHNDVAHDIFIRIFRNIVRLREPERLELWAARVALNAIRNELRRRRLRRWVFWNAFEDPGPLSYVADLDGRELVTRAYRILALLPADERVALSLQLFEMGTLETIAAATGCSRSTAKRRLQRARERFARLSQQDPLLKSWLQTSPLHEADDDG